MISTLLIGTVQLMTGCDSQPSYSNNDGTAQTNNIDKDMAKNDEMSVNLAPIDSSAKDETQANDAANIADEQIVSPLGYQKLGAV